MNDLNISLRPQQSGQQAVGTGSKAAKLAVIMINWNRADDTIECLESLLRSEEPIRIIVVDNGSTDNTIPRLLDWAAGIEPYNPPSGPLRRFTSPPLSKPINLRLVKPDEIETARPGNEQITVLEIGENRGFAAGNNIGMRFALADSAIAYCWCLNNDTVADPAAAGALVTRMSATHKVGMCGTQVRYYHRPGVLQALNGQRFNLLTGSSKGLYLDQPTSRAFNPNNIARETDFVLGASLAVSRAFIETVGYMEESYFLYFEEMDWSVRNRGRFVITFAHGAIVYHKEGGSIGSSSKKGQRSEASEYYLMRSRLKFYRRNFPLLLPIQYPLGLALILRRLLRRQPKKAGAMFRALLGLSRS